MEGGQADKPRTRFSCSSGRLPSGPLADCQQPVLLNWPSYSIQHQHTQSWQKLFQDVETGLPTAQTGHWQSALWVKIQEIFTFSCYCEELGCWKEGSILRCRPFTKVLLHSGVMSGFFAACFQTQRQQYYFDSRYSYSNGQSWDLGSFSCFAQSLEQRNIYRCLSHEPVCVGSLDSCPLMSLECLLSTLGESQPARILHAICLRAKNAAVATMFLVTGAPISSLIPFLSFFFGQHLLGFKGRFQVFVSSLIYQCRLWNMFWDA